MEAKPLNPSIPGAVKQSNRHGISHDFGLFGDAELEDDETLLGFGRVNRFDFCFPF